MLTSSMSTATGWSSATATTPPVRWPPLPVRCRYAHPGSTDKRTDEVTGERQRFASAILPAWARKSPQVAEVLPLLYLHGLSSSDFAPALGQFCGSTAGLAPATITRLTAQWQDDAAAFNQRSGRDRLCLHMGRRDPPQGPPGTRQGLSAGDDRGPRRRAQGADRAGRRVSRVFIGPGPICCATANDAA